MSIRLSWPMRWMHLQGELTRARRAAGLSQQKLADRLGVDRRTIQRWEDGETDCSSRDLFRWADALGLSVGLVHATDCDSSAASGHLAPNANVSVPAVSLTSLHPAAFSLPCDEHASACRTLHGNSPRADFPSPERPHA